MAKTSKVVVEVTDASTAEVSYLNLQWQVKIVYVVQVQSYLPAFKIDANATLEELGRKLVSHELRLIEYLALLQTVGKSHYIMFFN